MMKLVKVIYVFQYEDFEVLSQTAREVWLAEQCSAFETQIQTLSRERNKDHFLEDLYRKLKQVTRRWQSWNHRSFGGVTSRGCVCSCCTFKLNFYRMELLFKHAGPKILSCNQRGLVDVLSECACEPQPNIILLYNWRFSRYSAPIHWLVHGHMTSNNQIWLYQLS